MSDVFVSYAREDEPQARSVAEALRTHGYHVWRDEDLPAHRPYAEVIEERLNSARAVVVLWSTEAIKSHWVRAEADTARALGTLVQVSLDGTIPKMPFNQIQCADLKRRCGLCRLAKAAGERGGARRGAKPLSELSCGAAPSVHLRASLRQHERRR
jgi:hypothetical protein